MTDTIEPTLPTLVELIDRIDSKSTVMGATGPIAFANADFALIRAAAVALETEYAAARLELSTKAVEYLQVFRQMETLQDEIELESREADSYARKMHAGDDLLAEVSRQFGIRHISGPLAAQFREVIERVANRPAPRPSVLPKFITKETAPLIALES